METNKGSETVTLLGKYSDVEPEPEMLSKSKQDLGWTPFYMMLNFISAVGIIFVNKVVFTHDFHYATVLTGCHFFLTFIGLLFCLWFQMFEVKPVPFLEVLPLCCAFCGFVVFNNLSLQENTVGFYQLMKIMTTPVIVILQYFFYGIQVPNVLKLCLVPVIFGVCLVSVTEIDLTPKGFLYAVLGILSTSFYQIWVKTKQQDLHLNSFQLLFYQAPISCVMVLMVSPFLDPVFRNGGTDAVPITALINFSFSQEIVFWILLSCGLAFLVNLSIFLTIGNTSPISYNVLGHFKLTIISFGGIFVFGESKESGKITGIIIALVGIICYTHYKMQMRNSWEDRRNSTKTETSPQRNTELVTITTKST